LFTFGAGIITLLQSSCSKTTVQSLHILTILPIRSEINPWSVKYAADYLVSASISTPFVELDENEKWSFPFCSSWKRLNGSGKITCELLENLRWSDGSPMEPQEIVDSLQESVRTFHLSGIAELVQKITLEPPRQVTLEFRQNGLSSLWAFTGLDQAILAPDLRAEIRTQGFLHLDQGLRRGSGRFRLIAITPGHIKLEPNPYFPGTSSRAKLPVEIVGNLSVEQIKDRIIQRSSGDVAVIWKGSLSDPDLLRLKDAGLQEFNQPVPNAIATFYFGNHARNSMTKEQRRYLFSSIASKMLDARGMVGIPAIGFAPPSMFGALNKDSWKTILGQMPSRPKKPLKVDVFVMKALHDTTLYMSTKAVLAELPIQVNEVVYDPSEPNSLEWKRRSSNDYDLLFAYDESFSPDPDPFWRDIAGDITALSMARKAFFSDAELNAALLEPDLNKRAEDPFIIPLRRFGNELLVTPGIEVAPQEAFGVMLNLWAFKTSL
jgi:hypothetical protein